LPVLSWPVTTRRRLSAMPHSPKMFAPRWR
jgi:hypothetical protein